MKRKGPQKTPTEVIQKAIARYESGTKLSVIARELGKRRSTVKYWLDNATRFAAQDQESETDPIMARIQNRLTRQSWDIIFAALKTLKGKLEQASVRDLVAVVSELFDRQSQFGALAGSRTAPDRVMEKSEEVRITVQKYLKRQAGEGEPIRDLGAAPLEHLQTETNAGGPPSLDEKQGEGNGAT